MADTQSVVDGAPTSASATKRHLVSALRPALVLLACLALAACEPARTVRTDDRAQPPTATAAEAATCATPPASGATAAQDSCLGTAGEPASSGNRNVVGGPLQPCPSAHQTGFYRDGFCNTGADDAGVHVVCARVTDDFLTYSRSRGNDLVTARGGFPGLRAGDGWCLCARRWREAFDAGVAPPVVLEASHEAALQVASVKQFSGAP
ncbi:MAG: DUF2237 domain-containing protein [Deltaproteobacteria bacterium]|nr:DUF2237 domain-containing protein [Deltaproteobacteria bacterium]